MARLAALLVLGAASAAAAADVCALGSSSAGGVCRDALDLRQVEQEEAAEAGALEVSLLVVAHAQVKGGKVAGADALTTEDENPFGSITGALGGLIPGVTGSLTNLAAQQLIEALNSTLETIGHQADALVLQCRPYEDTMKARISSAEATLEARALVLEAQVNSTVAEYLPRWTETTALFGGLVQIVTAALNAAGQQDMARTIQDAMGAALAEADAVRQSLAAAPEAIAGLHTMVESEILERLDQLNATLESGLGQGDAFSQSLNQAFGGLLDTAANALANAVPGTDAANLRSTFDGLQTTEGAVASSLLISLQMLVGGLAEGATSTRALISPEVVAQQGAGARASALLALGIAAAAAALASL